MENPNQAAGEMDIESQNLRVFPSDQKWHYDAHIYFQLEEIAKTESLREGLIAQFFDLPIRIGTLIKHPIGPHPIPMFEVNFRQDDYSRIVSWIKDHATGYRVLIHPLTGNELKDHTEFALWLGEPVVLILSRLS